MNRRWLMGLDAGGGSGRCLLLDADGGEVIVTARPWQHPAVPGSGGLGFALDLGDLWGRLGAAAREALARAEAAPADVLGVAATSMRFAAVLLDADGEALYAGPNKDARASLDGLALAAEHGEALLPRTGHWPSPVFPAARLRWIQKSQPALLARADTLLALSDWVAWKLCGVACTDPSQAAESGLYDVGQRAWLDDGIEALGLPRTILPEVRAPGSALGGLLPEAAAHLGLAAGTPVAVAGGDTQCGLLGADALAPGQLAAVVGTTAPLMLVLDRPHVDGAGQLWTGLHLVPDRWTLEANAGPMGDALAAIAGVLHPGAPVPAASLLAEAARSGPGAGGVLSSIGAELMNAREMALPLGTLAFSHLSTPGGPTRADLARAVAEGMAYALRGNAARLAASAGHSPSALRLTGGMSRSPTFAQLVADVLARPVEVARTPEATALGAALCAGVGAGVFPDLEAAAARRAALRARFEPDPANASEYEERYEAWDALREARAPADGLARGVALQTILGGAEPPSAAQEQPARRPQILVTADLDETSLTALQDLGEVEYAPFRKALRVLTGAELVEALRGVDVFVTEVDVVDAGSLGELPALRVVASCRGDAVNVDVAACTALGIPVLNAPGRNADAVADLTLAFLLMLARKLPEASAFLRQPDLEAGDMGRMGQAFGRLRGGELWQKTVGLVGLGAVGRGVAARARAFGARVLVFDPFVPEEQLLLAGAEPVPLAALLARSDFVSLHAAVTDASRGLIGAAELARMRPGAFLVNTARAALVDEEALADALARGHLGGAALDVFSVEPPGADHPLLAFDHVIATPHVGGNTRDVAAHQGRIIREDLARLLRGERARCALNPEVLATFDWARPRPPVEAAVLEELARKPGPAVTDLQREKKAAPAARAAEAAPRAAAGSDTAGVQRASEAVSAILDAFLGRLLEGRALEPHAEGRDVTLHFRMPDVQRAFWLRLREGRVEAELGDPEAPADVQLKLKADVLDGMFTGRLNPMEAAMDGRLSFSGDTAKAMSLQEFQGVLSAAYAAARAEIGDPGDLASLPDAPGAAPAPAATADDPRRQLVQVVDELYAQQLITATGGNVSVRIEGRDELWITPSQLFKGELSPEALVRIDLSGAALDEGARAASSERLMHCAVYSARPEARAVIHAHAPHATILANTGLPFLPISTDAAFFGELPRIPFLMPGTQELADAVAEGIREAWAVLLQNHGLLVAGRSLRRAADMVEIVERTAEILLGCYAVGKEPPVLPEEAVRTLRKMGDLVA